MFIAQDIRQFKSLFVQQLKNMLSPDELGAFILVLANSRQDAALREALGESLRQNFLELKYSYDQGTLVATDDDMAVFTRLLQQDLEAMSVWETRYQGDWEICYNAIRALRPTRSSAEILSSIQADFVADKFHFNKPFLAPEILWQGCHNDVPLRVLYNKFPFSPYHLLIVTDAEKAQSQFLDEKTHLYICSLVNEQQTALPGFSIGYNSLAAGASVNHLHFQGFIREQALPVEHPQWLHNGGEKPYPLNCTVTDSAKESWDCVQAFHKNNQPYNILYRSGRVYLLSRAFQGTVELPGWLNGCGWLDLCGVMTLSGQDEFKQLRTVDIETGLTLLNKEVRT